MDDQPKIPLELQRRIEKRWEARFSQAQRLNDGRLEMSGRSQGKTPRPSKPTYHKGAA
jgi:hypothetical protein